VQECIDTYVDLSKEIFDVDKVIAGAIPVGDNECRFDFNTLETSIKDIIKKKLGKDDYTMEEKPKVLPTGQRPSQCRTFVVTRKALDAGYPTVFRSYSAKGVRATQCAIWEAARATTAAPSFFKPMYIERVRPGMNYVDGGLGDNNPAQIALKEAGDIWPSSKIFCVVSIGTGRSRAVKIVDVKNNMPDLDSQRALLKRFIPSFPKLLSLFPTWQTAQRFPSGVQALIKIALATTEIATNSENVHQQIDGLAHSVDKTKQFPYFRFNVACDMADIGLQEWDKSEEITAHTLSYLGEADIGRRRTACVKCLVQPPEFRRRSQLFFDS